MVNVFILLGGIALVVTIIGTLDIIAHRKERRSRDRAA
jgi:hypothetical protein